MFQIGDLKVKKLSGPITFRYLLPKKEVFLAKAEDNVFLPIIILLGDRHDAEKRCEPCEEEKGCYDVSSQTFLKAFNKIARDIPIDMFIEHSKKHMIQEGKSLFGRFHNATESCYTKEDRKSGLFDCKYPNMRWHYTDSRLWEGKMEYIFQLGRQALEQIKLIVMTRMFFNLITFREDSLFIQYLIILLYDGWVGDWTVDQAILRWSKILSETIMNNPQSIIFKQLAKYKIDVNLALYIYTSTKQSIERNGSLKRKVDEIKIREMFKPVTEIIDVSIGNISSIDDIMKHPVIPVLQIIRQLEDYWISFTSCLLDLYFIGRMFKPPKGNLNSYVTFAFFGDSHSESICDLLTISQDWYDLKYETKITKCIEFIDDVNFTDDLAKYVAMRQKLQDVKPYINQIQTELGARLESRKEPYIALLTPFRKAIPFSFSSGAASLIYQYVKKLVTLLTNDLQHHKKNELDQIKFNATLSGKNMDYILTLVLECIYDPLPDTVYSLDLIQSVTSLKGLQPSTVKVISDVVFRFLERFLKNFKVSVDKTLTLQRVVNFTNSVQGEYLRLPPFVDNATFRIQVSRP